MPGAWVGPGGSHGPAGSGAGGFVLELADIPVELAEFLPWFQDATHRAWAVEATTPDPLNWSWQRGTRWTGGFSEAELAAAEAEFGMAFPREYRQLLATLGATDRPMLRAAGRESRRATVERAGFYNWRRDWHEIQACSESMVQGVLFDVKHGSWPEAWGSPPLELQQRLAKAEALCRAAPKPMPVFGHRGVFHGSHGHDIVLSIHQTDVVVYGSTLRNYLIAEMCDTLAVRRDALRGLEPEVSAETVPFWSHLD